MNQSRRKPRRATLGVLRHARVDWLAIACLFLVALCWDRAILGQQTARPDAGAKLGPTRCDLSLINPGDARFNISGDKGLIQTTAQGVEFRQPIGLPSDQTKLGVSIPSTKQLSLGIDYSILTLPQPGPGVVSGLMIQLQYEDSSTVSPQFGLAALPRGMVGFVFSEKPTKDVRDVRFHKMPLQAGRLLVTKAEKELHFAIGSSNLSMVPLGSVACSDAAIRGIEVYCTPCQAEETQAKYLLSGMEWTGDEYFLQPRPIDYWSYVWPIKWIFAISLLTWLVRMVWRNPEVLKRKIF